MSWLLDLANILGGFLLALPLLRQSPVGGSLDTVADTLGRFRIAVAIVALVAAGYFLIVHLTEGRLFHFELVGLAVGLLLLRPVSAASGRRAAPESPVTQEPLALLVCVLGLIAIVVGLQGLVTPN